jgi:hypothetical protein
MMQQLFDEGQGNLNNLKATAWDKPAAQKSQGEAPQDTAIR